MKKTITVMAASLLSALAAIASEVPRVETYLGYDFVRFQPSSAFVPSFNANGGSAQAVVNFGKWAGIVFEGGAVNKTVFNGLDFDTTVAHLVAGPRFTYRNHSKFTPFAEVMFGASYGTTSAEIVAIPAQPLPIPGLPVVNPLAGNPQVFARIGASNTAFAMMAGGGLDIKITDHLAIRPIEADYYLTRTPNFFTGDDTNKNNWRYSAGFNFSFGH